MISTTESSPRDDRHSGGKMPCRLRLAELIQYVRDYTSSQFVRNIYETMATRVFLLAIGIVTSVAVARILGPEGRGFYYLATNIVALGVQFTNLGLHASNTYYVAKDRKQLPLLVGNSLAIGIGVGGLVAFAGWLFCTVIPSAAPVNGLLLAMSLLWIPASLIYLLYQNLLIGINEVRTYNVVDMLIKVVALVIMAAIFIFNVVSPETVFAIDIIVGVIGLAFVYRRLRRHLSTIGLSLSLFRDTLVYGFKAYVTCLLSFLTTRIDVFIVDFFLGTTLLGYYSIALGMGDMFLMLPQVIGLILFPRLTSMPDRREKMALMWKVTKYSTVIFLALSVLAVIFAEPVISLMYGNQYDPSVPAFVWLVPGLFFLAIETLMVQYAASEGYPVFVIFAWMGTLLVKLAGNIVLVPSFGISGAAFASTISYIFIALVIGLYVRFGGPKTLSTGTQL